MLLFPVMPATVVWIPLRTGICFDALCVALNNRHALFNLQSNYFFKSRGGNFSNTPVSKYFLEESLH